jgi:hypothetical protein
VYAGGDGDAVPLIGGELATNILAWAELGLCDMPSPLNLELLLLGTEGYGKLENIMSSTMGLPQLAVALLTGVNSSSSNRQGILSKVVLRDLISMSFLLASVARTIFFAAFISTSPGEGFSDR